MSSEFNEFEDSDTDASLDTSEMDFEIDGDVPSLEHVASLEYMAGADFFGNYICAVVRDKPRVRAVRGFVGSTAM